MAFNYRKGDFSLRKLTKRTEAVVRLHALRHNIENVKSRLHEGCRMMAVLKGDGYGHGIQKIYPTLHNAGVTAVSSPKKCWRLAPIPIFERPSHMAYSSIPTSWARNLSIAGSYSVKVSLSPLPTFESLKNNMVPFPFEKLSQRPLRFVQASSASG